MANLDRFIEELQSFDQHELTENTIKLLQDLELAKKSGNVLTQTMDENGNLIGVRETVNFEEREAAEDIKKKE